MTAALEETKALTPGERRTEKQKLYDAEVLERVKRGIALLEREYGPDWVDKIDLSKLDLCDGDRCVLGQVYGNYEDGCCQLDLVLFGLDDEAEEYGIDVAEEYGFSLPEDENDWKPLQRCWEDVLTPMVRAR